jgi:glycosyltransferase involved in cell wall biosynthesis
LKLLFFVPSFNDQLGLPELVQKLVVSYPEATVLVVDDGSMPAIVLTVNPTFEIPHVVLLRLANNEGLGMATSIAVDYFLDGDFDYLIRLDADGQHPQDEIERLLLALRECEADVVWGERHNNLKTESSKAIMASVTKTIIAWLGRVIFRSQVQDWFTGFFAINRIAAANVASAYLERYCEVQLLCIFHNADVRIKTLQVEQLDRKFGKSSIRFLDGVLIFLRSTLIMVLYALRMHPK